MQRRWPGRTALALDHLLPASKADLLRRRGRRGEAAEAYRAALARRQYSHALIRLHR